MSLRYKISALFQKSGKNVRLFSETRMNTVRKQSYIFWDRVSLT